MVGSTFTFKMMMRHVADGRLDGCVTGYCNSWDVIGGLLLVQEAGGVASDFIAENGLLEHGSALACTPGPQTTLEQVRGC